MVSEDDLADFIKLTLPKQVDCGVTDATIGCFAAYIPRIMGYNTLQPHQARTLLGSCPSLPSHIHCHLQTIHKAISVGVSLQGYFAWSLMDNFERAHSYGNALDQAMQITQAKAHTQSQCPLLPTGNP
jgi:hypothetical protein